MMPPIFCYTTFNKLGMTAKGLPSYLNTNQDFEMYICDNDSRDDTWDYIQSLKDPRIKGKKRFDRNYGAINTINWALTYRKKHQALINVEYDAYNLTTDFVDKFQQVEKHFKAGFIHAYYVLEKKIRYYNIVWNGGVYFCPTKPPKVPPMSFCYIPSVILDRLGYLDEASYMGDIEVVARVRSMKKRVGITPSVLCIHIKDKDEMTYEGQGYNCQSCHRLQDVCRRTDTRCCVFRPGSMATKDRVYPTFSKFNREKREEILKKRLSGELPLCCGTSHLQQLAPWEEEMRKENYEFIASYYEGYLKGLGV